MTTIKLKSTSPLMKFFAFFLGKAFSTNYCTTIGNTIYVPSKEWIAAQPNLLAHEIVHIWQRSKYPLYALMYLTFWRKQFEAQAYAVQAWYRNKMMDGTDVDTNWAFLTNQYFTPFGIYLFLSNKKPDYVEPSDEVKSFVLQHMARLTSPGSL
jgi:hypothetical protein